MKKFACTHNVNYDTFRRRVLNLTKSHLTAHENQKLLTDVQEKALSDWLQLASKTGHAWSLGTIRYTVQGVAKSVKLHSVNRVERFLKRLHEVVFKKPAPLDPKHARAFNCTVVEHYFKL